MLEDCSADFLTQLRGMGYAKHYVREALKHCRPGDVATAVGILSGWAAQTPGVRDTGEAQNKNVRTNCWRRGGRHSERLGGVGSRRQGHRCLLA